jgi:outer membrane lipoprotein SlyB
MASRFVPFHILSAAAALALLGGCTPSYSPNSYDAAAVQKANKAEQGIVVGVRKVDVTAAGTTGALVGGAAGGIAGSQAGSGSTSAFGALGGSVVGGLLGIGVERAAGDTTAYEYVVRETNNQLVSVTQRDKTPLVVGQHVLVISGAQARVVPDYTVPLPPEFAAGKPASPPAPVEQTPLSAPAGVPAGSASPTSLSPAPILPPAVIPAPPGVPAAVTRSLPEMSNPTATEAGANAPVLPPAVIPTPSGVPPAVVRSLPEATSPGQGDSASTPTPALPQGIIPVPVVIPDASGAGGTAGTTQAPTTP